jgi:hypothetical protein
LRFGKEANLFSAVGLLVAGLLCALAGLVELGRAKRLLRVGKEARARLVPGKAKPDEDEDEEPAPLLRFRTEEGLEIEFEEPMRAKGDAARLGTEVDVVYDPNDPRSARRKAFTHLFAPGLFWLAFALLLVVAGIVSQVFSSPPGATSARERRDVAMNPKTVARAAVKIVFIEQDS